MCLARDLREIGRYEDSVTLLSCTYAISKQRLGRSFPGTLAAAKSLSVALRRTGRFEGARRLTQAARSRYRAKYTSVNGRHARDALGEPVVVADGREHVLLAVPQQDVTGDRRRVEPTGCRTRARVDPAVRRSPRRLLVVAQQHRADPGVLDGHAVGVGSSLRRSSRNCTGFSRMRAERAMKCAAISSGSATPVVKARTLEAAMPSNQSSPSASGGARVTRAAARVTRSGSSAAQASACGAPPERPTTAKRSSP